MNPTEESPSPPSPEVATDLDHRKAARIARLLSFYPANWRRRYGDEFEAVLVSSLSDGKGGVRLSFDVAREGVAARLEEGGFIGKVAPQRVRARASLMTIIVAVVGFLASAAVLGYYAKGWQRTPAREFFNGADMALVRSKAYRVLQATLQSHPIQLLRQAASHSTPNSPARKALLNAQNKLWATVDKTAAYRVFEQGYARTRGATGAPVVFDHLAHVALDGTIACLGLILAVAGVAWVRTVRSGHRKGLILPIALLMASGILFAVGEITSHSSSWDGAGGWDSLHRWPQAAASLCAAAALILALVGGLKLVRRVELGVRLSRAEGFLAAVTATFLATALASTLLWVGTLLVQAPGFLTSKDQGIFGTSYLPVFLVVLVAMTGALWMVTAHSARCLRNSRELVPL
jgi:hypothetical protein